MSGVTPGALFRGGENVEIRESELTEETAGVLLALSRDWEAENSCYGYRANGREDLEGRRVFLAEDAGETVGYLFGHGYSSRKMSSIMPEGSRCFEVEELYVIPSRRSMGVGKALFAFAEETVQGEADYITLSTATKNWRSILHFYVDEVGMEMWSSRLFRKLPQQR